MKQYFTKKVVTASLFGMILAGGLCVNVIQNRDILLSNIKGNSDVETIIEELENTVNEHVYARYQFIDGFGYIQALMRKKEQNNFEVIKDNNGFLHYTYFGTGIKETGMLVDALKEYKESIVNDNTKFLYVMTPDKNVRGYTTFDSGLPYNYANETADDFLQQLESQQIDFFDFRVNLRQSGIADAELFYKTDHHWTTKTAFWAFGELSKHLMKTYEESIKNLEFYINPANYNFVTYENSFLGSMARKTGIQYSGCDDYTLIYPKFFTDYTYDATIDEYDTSMSGRFDQSLIFMNNLRFQGNRYDFAADKYSSYLDGNKAFAHIQNTQNPDGPKLLIVKDSFIVPVAAFMSTVCSDIYLVDPRYYNDDITQLTNSIENLDYVIVSFTPQDLAEEFFQFKNN